jgi:hypothetical protein
MASQPSPHHHLPGTLEGRVAPLRRGDQASLDRFETPHALQVRLIACSPSLGASVRSRIVWAWRPPLSRQAPQPSLDPLLNLLTLPIRPESELQTSSREILASRPDLDKVVLAIW